MALDSTTQPIIFLTFKMLEVETNFLEILEIMCCFDTTLKPLLFKIKPCCFSLPYMKLVVLCFLPLSFS